MQRAPSGQPDLSMKHKSRTDEEDAAAPKTSRVTGGSGPSYSASTSEDDSARLQQAAAALDLDLIGGFLGSGLYGDVYWARWGSWKSMLLLLQAE